MRAHPALRVLIVDDDKSTRAALAEILKIEGFSVDECGDGATALLRLQGSSYDVLLTDYIMPGMDGLALASAARELCGALRCLVMSGHPPLLDGPDYLLWVSKPIDIDDLLIMLRP